MDKVSIQESACKVMRIREKNTRAREEHKGHRREALKMEQMQSVSLSAEHHDFQAEALFLANHYADMLMTRESLKERIDGSWVFTRDMAIDELVKITPNYGGDHVQSSSISDTTARITDKLMNGYVERRQGQIEKEREACRKEYEYVDWKIRVIETAIAERLEKIDRILFMKNRGDGWSYREMQHGYKTGNLQMQTIRNAILKGVDAIQAHLQFMAYLGSDYSLMERLMREVRDRE